MKEQFPLRQHKEVQGDPSAAHGSYRHFGEIRRDILVQMSTAHSAHSQHHYRYVFLQLMRTQRKGRTKRGDCLRSKKSTVVTTYLQGILSRTPIDA